MRHHGSALRLADPLLDNPVVDYLVLGAQKSGTTSLLHYLNEHPRLPTPVMKEAHFFNQHWARGVAWYRSRIAARTPGALLGEATPYYLFHPRVPARVREVAPDVRLVALLRDPIERAWSHYQHERCRLGVEQLGFEAALDAEVERLDGERERLLADSGSVSHAHQHFSYVARGRYAEQLDAWLEHFPREQLLVLRAEDMFADPRAVVARVLRFVGAGDERVPDRYEVHYPRVGPALDMPPVARRRLEGVFAEPNADLHDRFGIGWQPRAAIIA